PRRWVETVGLACLAAGAAVLALKSPIGDGALVAACMVVLSGALAFNLVGGAVCALAGALALVSVSHAPPLSVLAASAALVAIGLVAGGFASHARERQDEWAHNVRRYRALLDSLPIGLIELDERGLITQANPMAGTIVGCAASELLGQSFDRLGTWEARPILAMTTRAIRYMRQPEARFISSFLYRPDSTSRDVQVDWVYQRSVKGRRPLRVTALITDITERRRALKALKDREHQLAERTDLLRITMDSLDHGLAAFSPSNVLTEWNARFPEMLGLPSPLARRNTPAIAIFRFMATLGAFGVGVTEGKVWDRMDRLLHAPNQDDVPWIGGRHLRFTAHTMPDGGWVWRIEDRTKDLHLRDIEQNRQKMEALGQLASGVAHELNNTLQPIFSLSELGVSQAPADSLTARCFARITDAAERAETIVRGVLTFARNAPAPDENTAIVPALYDAVAFIQTGLPPQILLDVTVDDGIPTTAMARLDRRELGQVLTNLVTNAADAMDHVGTIQVTCRGDLLRFPVDGDGVELGEESRPAVAIAVVDTGKGMDHATKQRIFEPFFTTKDEGHGTGLGLAVAFGIVRNWGGRIDVESEEGLGSAFTVWVPLLDVTDE
ncbi:MAG: PAS-domain containing protein, partial [Rhodospirillaceae bacterium]|nr:PAS-domain containing protein [Rhodospirillaceae bacterium]